MRSEAFADHEQGDQQHGEDPNQTHLRSIVALPVGAADERCEG